MTVTTGARVSVRSRLHNDRVAAVLGIALGVSFSICFLTGVLSHLIQDPPAWFAWPSRPAGLYRVTQGLHVVTGIAAIPLLLAKLWVVYPKLFAWPPFRGFPKLLERVLLIPLIGGGLFQLFTGLANINLWYPWPFNFRRAHYWVAWVTIGALVVHLGAKWAITRRELSRRGARPVDGDHGLGDDDDDDDEQRLDRRRFLLGTFAASGVLTVFTIGQTFRPLSGLALLAPRRPDVGPQGFPVNRTAAAAGVVTAARGEDFRLVVEGRVRRRLELTLDELRSLPQHDATLPIACVEGWSTSQRWSGVRVRELLSMAGAPDGAEATVHSLQRRRAYRSSELNASHAHDDDTLLALRVNDEELDLDHGYPLRLIGPNRPGVMQTKWVTRIVVR
jgi:hypothetical protein